MVKLNFDFGFSEPLLLVGEGSYALTAVKEIHATDEFLGLDINTRKYQTEESFEDIFGSTGTKMWMCSLYLI